MARSPLDTDAISLALREIASHPLVRTIEKPESTGDSVRVEFDIEVDYGARWTAEGHSPNGVLPVERVRFEFPLGYPEDAPEISLRGDFSRSHAHIQPYLTADNRPVPCVVDGLLSEFAAQRGIISVVEQLAVWLRHAATGELNDPEQGWEPMRRDRFEHLLLASRLEVSHLSARNGGLKYIGCEYYTGLDDGCLISFRGQLNEIAKLPEQYLLQEQVSPRLWKGQTVAIVLWAGKHANGDPIVSGEYRPDPVEDLSGLMAFAADHGLKATLESALNAVRNYAQRRGDRHPIPIVFLVRRPFRVKDTESDIEICAYLLDARFRETRVEGEVTPLAQHDKIEPSLLVRLNGVTSFGRWMALGCGSLGSKIIMHATRSGNAPTLVADKGNYLPHNVARHALYPAGPSPIGWLGGKASDLCAAISSLGQTAEPLHGDHRDLIARIAEDKELHQSTFLLNTTASLVAREGLVRRDNAPLPRLVEGVLFDRGQLGLMAIEGPAHNPNSVELIASFYQHASEQPDLRHRVFREDSIAFVPIGEGCGSLTMQMSDATLSLMAAAMSELLPEAVETASGSLHLFRRDGSAVLYETLQHAPFRRLDIEGLENWTLAIHPSVEARVMEEVASHPTVETGGVLVGFTSLIARSIVVTDLLPAPPDSVRHASKFVLGVEGLEAAQSEVIARSGYSLRCLGTWHSHLGDAEPSRLDHSSALKVATAGPHATVFLIVGTDGFRAISASLEAPIKGA